MATTVEAFPIKASGDSLCRAVRVGAWPADGAGRAAVSAAKAADEMQGRHVHSLRHTHATLALAAHMDVITLAEHLGHASLAMTQHYSRSVTTFREEVAGWPGRGEFFLRREPPVRSESTAEVGAR